MNKSMYKAVGVNEYGQVYSAKGILEQYKEGLESSVREFDNIANAIEYAKGFVVIYPQVRFEIYKGSEIVEEVCDEDYWLWKNKNAEEWRVLNAKGAKLHNIFLNAFLGLVGLLVALVAHSASDVPLIVKFFVFPLVVVVGWHVVNRLFAKVC